MFVNCMPQVGLPLRLLCFSLAGDRASIERGRRRGGREGPFSSGGGPAAGLVDRAGLSAGVEVPTLSDVRPVRTEGGGKERSARERFCSAGEQKCGKRERHHCVGNEGCISCLVYVSHRKLVLCVRSD